jgi:hypothetical protein
LRRLKGSRIVAAPQPIQQVRRLRLGAILREE